MSSRRLRIALIVASTRTVRFADLVVPWVQQHLVDAGFELDVIDVREVTLPYYDLPVAPAMAERQYTNDAELALGERLDAADGYVILTNEFNHGYSAALKNVLDHYFAEFQHKPVAFVGYGNVGGARAIEQLRQVAAELDMVSVRESVHVIGFQFPAVRAGGEDADAVFAALEPKMVAMLENLRWWARALTTARAAGPDSSLG